MVDGRMKCIKKKEIEEIVEAEGDREQHLNIENVNIARKDYNLEIINQEDRLIFNFIKDETIEYQIKIYEDNTIGFERYVHRPNHDHDDMESLQEVVDPSKIMGKPRKGAIWRKRFPYGREGYDFFKILFGSRLDDFRP